MTDFRSVTASRERPGFAAYTSGWSRTQLTWIEQLDPRLSAVVAALETTHYQATAAQFRIEADPAVAWYLSRDQVEIDFFRDFFAHTTVAKAFPEVTKQRNGSFEFFSEAPFKAFGDLANFIQRGGAYKTFAGSGEDVLKLATEFADAAIGLRFSEAVVWSSEEAWSSWFFEVAWDHSHFWLDKRTGIATVLLATDTD